MVKLEDYVLDETVTLLFRWLSFEIAKASLERIAQAIKESYLRLERISPERFEKAKRLGSGVIACCSERKVRPKGTTNESTRTK
jgi:hypothetical protein